MPRETVLLQNGNTEAKGLVAIVMLTLRKMMQEKPIVLYELVMLCRDRDHTLWGQTGTELMDYDLVQRDGTVHSSIRNIVLSGTEGDGLELSIKNPIQQPAQGQTP